MNHDLRGLRVAVLLTNGVEQVELLEPCAALENAGADVTIIAPECGEFYAMNHHDKGRTFNTDMSLEQADANNFDVVFLPGGALNADALRVDERAQNFVRGIDRQGKPVAVICHGPWLLISAGLVKGRRLTSYHTIQDDVRNAGGMWTDKEVEIDGNWVSSRQPKDIPAFNQAMLQMFAQEASRLHVGPETLRRNVA